MRTIAIAAALMVLVASPSRAQVTHPDESFTTRWDSDGNGRVTLIGARDQRTAMFDQDGDGKLSAAE